jgi:hypothetical protein
LLLAGVLGPLLLQLLLSDHMLIGVNTSELGQLLLQALCLLLQCCQLLACCSGC